MATNFSTAPKNGCWPYNNWLGRCAVAAVRQQPTICEHETILALGARCRELLRGVKRPVIPLRREPTQMHLAQMELEREIIRSRNAAGGVEAARAALPGTLIHYYTEDYVSWAARHRGSSKGGAPGTASTDSAKPPVRSAQR